jgi:hypothetical protein
VATHDGPCAGAGDEVTRSAQCLDAIAAVLQAAARVAVYVETTLTVVAHLEAYPRLVGVHRDRDACRGGVLDDVLAAPPRNRSRSPLPARAGSAGYHSGCLPQMAASIAGSREARSNASTSPVQVAVDAEHAGFQCVRRQSNE